MYDFIILFYPGQILPGHIFETTGGLTYGPRIFFDHKKVENPAQNIRNVPLQWRLQGGLQPPFDFECLLISTILCLS